MAQKYYTLTEIAERLDITRQSAYQKLITYWKDRAILVKLGNLRIWQVPETLVDEYKPRAKNKSRVHEKKNSTRLEKNSQKQI